MAVARASGFERAQDAILAKSVGAWQAVRIVEDLCASTAGMIQPYARSAAKFDFYTGRPPCGARSRRAWSCGSRGPCTKRSANEV